MDIINEYWVYKFPKPVQENIIEKDNIDENIIFGKWMLFFPKNVLNDYWQILCNHFDNNKLKGIEMMKCSTAKENARASNKDEGVIILYCNGEEKHIMKCGKRILRRIDYSKYAKTPYIYYKSNNQTTIGTRATGIKKNYLFRIEI